VPFINDHVMLGDPELAPTPGVPMLPPEKKGVHGVIGEKTEFDPTNNTLYGNLKVFSAIAPHFFAAGKDDISLGFRCKYVEESGVDPVSGLAYDYVQRNIRGNHGAFVQTGRVGGDVSVMDGAETLDVLTVCFDHKEAIHMPGESLKKRNLRGHTALVKLAVAAYGQRALAKRNIASMPLSRFAFDAADEEAVASDPSLGDIADVLKDVLPQIAEINDAIADASGGSSDDEPELEPELGSDGMPVMDSAGKPKMKPKVGMDGKPVMKKKAAPAPEVNKTGMDSAIEAAVKPLREEIAKLVAGGAKGIMGEIAKRDALARQVSDYVGTFDASEMTAQDVAAYAVGKLNIPAQKGQEVTAVTAWLHGRTPARVTQGAGFDSAEIKTTGKVADFLNAK